jgi:hypothetical protein
MPPVNRALPSVVLRTPWHLRLLHFFGFRTGGDMNMSLANAVGLELSPNETEAAYELLRGSIKSARDRAEFVEVTLISRVLAVPHGSPEAWAIFRDAPAILGMSTKDAGECLRIWAGCMCGAKAIALGTRNGRNWPWWRHRAAKRIQADAEHDAFFAAGALAAVAFKAGRNEAFSFCGIPKYSILRKGLLVLQDKAQA